MFDKHASRGFWRDLIQARRNARKVDELARTMRAVVVAATRGHVMHSEPLGEILDQIDATHRSYRETGYRDGIRAMGHAHDEAVRSGIRAAAIMLRRDMEGGTVHLRPRDAIEAAAKYLEAKADALPPEQPAEVGAPPLLQASPRGC